MTRKQLRRAARLLHDWAWNMLFSTKRNFNRKES